MDHHAELASRGHGVARGVVNSIRKQHDGLDILARYSPRAGHHGTGERGRLAIGIEPREIARPLQWSGPLRKLEYVQIKIFLEPGRPVEHPGPGLFEPAHTGGVVGRGHGRRRIERQDDRPALEFLALQAEHRPEQQKNDQQDRDRAQGQQQSPPRRHDLREDPAVEDPRQHHGRDRDRQHGQEAVPLLERDMKHGACPVWLRPRPFLPYRILSDYGKLVKGPDECSINWARQLMDD